MIAIVTPNPDTPAETFVRQHIRLIQPGKTVVVYWEGNGNSLDGISSNRIPARSNSVLGKLVSLRSYMLWGYPGLLVGHQGKQLEKFFKHHQVEAVLAEFGPTGCAVMRVCDRLNLPLFVNFHGHDATVMAKRKLIRRAYRFLNKRATGFICGSNHFKQILIDLNISANKIQVIPCGIEMEEFGPLEQGKDDGLVLAVGRFVEKKAPHLTIQAFAKVVEQCPEARLEMIGGGPLLEECKILIDRLDLTQQVILHGVKDHQFVKSKMKQASVFVQHSVIASNGDMESQGVSLLEAMASSTPQVVTDHNGFSETVLENETGFLVPEGDTNQMANRIIELLSDPIKRSRFGIRSQEIAKSKFESRSMAEKIRNLMLTSSRVI
ncbi:glycosyltransferase [Aureitalea marina]|uniref:Glycosyl transferase family 1 domain-containing protein n=1 Tax=Aureitalea marina TaxID=930804 RepID=A0A2S7KNM9_9FLAO|nr:glycosyltransferase [Aureitalea marina]PQB04236.1 hypothetical protein BST85_04450 [Aureitalea marina]